MNIDYFSAQMAQNARRIQTLVEGVSDEQARWKPNPESWSILEVVNHLHDEEREDFRVRLDHILHKPDQPWPPIYPQEWVTERRYNERDLHESLTSFLRARQDTLAWLGTLGTPDWERTAPAPWGAPMSAGNMFAAMVAHDLLHLRQLVELHWAYTAEQFRPYQPGYAGDW